MTTQHSDIILRDSILFLDFFNWLQDTNYLPSTFQWTITKVELTTPESYEVSWWGIDSDLNSLTRITSISLEDLEASRFEKTIILAS